jgi:transcriptional regulator
MYIPSHYRNSDSQELIQFIRAHSFGLLISGGEEEPMITHLPFVIESEEPLVITSHLAKSNPHAAQLTDGKKVVLVFNGPHAYVSPSHYNSKQNVPTWNYIAVHAHGVVEICDEASKSEMLKEMIAAFEPEYRKQYDALPNSYLEPMKRAIVGFKVKIDRLEGKFKLSQNKTEDEITRIREHFAKDGKNNDLARYM